MAPITKLKKKTRPFIGTLECQHAWDMIKKCYIEAPMLNFNQLVGRIPCAHKCFFIGSKGNGIGTCCHSNSIQRRTFNLVIMLFGFQKKKMKKVGKVKKKRYDPYIIQYLLFNNVVLLVTLGKFEPNYMLANLNKLKPYKYVDQVVSKPIVNQTSQEYVEINNARNTTLAIKPIYWDVIKKPKSLMKEQIDDMS